MFLFVPQIICFTKTRIVV